MAAIQGLTASLQERSLDICCAYQQVSSVRHQLQTYRDHAEEKHDEWWEAVTERAQELGVAPALPRRCARQTTRNNMPAETPKIYYRRTLTIPVLDEVLAQFEARFGALQRLAIKGLYLVPSVLVRTPESTVRQSIREFAAHEGAILPQGTNMDTLEAEVDRWIDISQTLPPAKSTTHAGPQLPACDSPAAALQLARDSAFPCIATLLELVCTWPVTTCECERNVSALGRVKTALRSTMGQSRFKGLALLHVHYGLHLDQEEVLKRFARKHPRRDHPARLR